MINVNFQNIYSLHSCDFKTSTFKNLSTSQNITKLAIDRLRPAVFGALQSVPIVLRGGQQSLETFPGRRSMI